MSLYVETFHRSDDIHEEIMTLGHQDGSANRGCRVKSATLEDIVRELEEHHGAEVKSFPDGVVDTEAMIDPGFWLVMRIPQ